MDKLKRALLLHAGLLGLLAWTAPAQGQAVLLVVEETMNGTPLSPPFASHEGISEALFDDGVIVIDLPGGTAADPARLSRTAVAAGADYVLTVAVDYDSAGTGAPRVDGHAAFRLVQVPAGKALLQATADGTNNGRERTMDQAGLGAEIGRTIPGKAWAALRQASP